VTVVWLATIAGATYDVLPTGISDYMLVACPLYVVGMGIWRTFGVSEAA